MEEVKEDEKADDVEEVKEDKKAGIVEEVKEDKKDKRINRFKFLFGKKTNRFNTSFGFSLLLVVWLKISLKLHFSLYKGVREFNLLKALKIYWILSRSNLGDNIRSFHLDRTSIIPSVISLSLNFYFLHFFIFAAKF